MVSGVVALVWGFSEPYFPVLTEVSVFSSKVTRPLRVVQISDLHCDPVERAEPKLVEMIHNAEPDLILFTGDGVNSDEGIPTFKKTIRALTKIAPVYGVRGNWEVWWFQHVDTFEGTGMHELDGHAVVVDVRGQSVALGGTRVDGEDRMEAALDAMPEDAFRIALHHYPAAAEIVGDKADLLLSGDTHGGQIVLPFIGPLIRVRRWNDRFYKSGLHRTDSGLLLYVNLGVGMEGGDVPRFRLNCPPEITLLTVRPMVSPPLRRESQM